MERIRKITIGDIKEGITYPIGKQIKRAGTIHRIYLDEEFLELYGEVRYCIEVLPEGKNHTRLWKSFPHKQVTIEYDTSEA
jgi:hypothetical protein